MNKIIILVCLLGIISTACSTLTSLEKNILPESIYENSIQVGTKNVPLPEGKWIVIGRGISDDFFIVYLLNEHENRLFSYIKITVDSPYLEAKYGYSASKDLNRNNMHHVVSNSNSVGEAQDGWYINNAIVHFTPKNKSSAVGAAADYIKSHNYTISNNMIKVAHRFTGKLSKGRFLQVEYNYNPEAHGFPKSNSENWNTSEWNAVRTNNDPRKVAFIDKLKSEHEQWHEKVKNGFND